MLQCLGDLAERGERGHQAECGPGGERVQRRELAPALRCPSVVTSRRSFDRQRLERGAYLLGKSRALRLQPALELAGLAEIEAVQKRSGVEINRPREVTMLDRVFKGLDVARHDGWVQS